MEIESVQSTGVKVDFPMSRARPELLEPQNNEHVWIAMACHVVSAEKLRAGQQLHLDTETLATIQVGCYVCEQPYSNRLAYRKCPGEPNGDT